VTHLDVAGLAASFSIRVRSSPSTVIMERSALLRAMAAIDEVELNWQAALARSARTPDEVAFYGLLEEMLTADVLLRAWAAFVASSVDGGRRSLQPQSAAAMITRTLLLQRRRLLTTVLDAGLDLESLQQLDRHRRSCERWNDVLLAVFPATATTRALRFDLERTQDFADLWPSPEICARRLADPVVVTAMKSALTPLDLTESPRGQAWSNLGAAMEAALQYDRRTAWKAVSS